MFAAFHYLDFCKRCPQNVKLADKALWLYQTLLLGPKSNMDKITDAVHKIQIYTKDFKNGL